MDEARESVLVGIFAFVIGGVLSLWLTLLFNDAAWEKRIVGHGAAHYTAEGKFEWNGGKDK